MPEPTLKQQIADDWEDLFRRIKDMPLKDQITRIGDYTRAVTTALAEEIDHLRC